MEVRSEQHKGSRIAVHDWMRSRGSGPIEQGYACAVYGAGNQLADFFEGSNSPTLFNSADEAVDYAKSQIDAGKLLR